MSEPQRTKVGEREGLVKDLGALSLLGPSGAVWGLDSAQLNANLVTLRADETMPEHRNDEVDVLLVVCPVRARVSVPERARARSR